MTTSTLQHNSSRTTDISSTMRRERPSSHCVYYIHPFISDVLTICCDYISSCYSLLVNILSAPSKLDSANLTRFSLLVLACHHLDAWNEAHVPPSTWIWLALLSFSSFFCLLLTRQEAAMATALVTLFVLEAVVPLSFCGFTLALVWKQVSWTTGVALLSVVWVLLASMANWIRRTVYQSMGHG